MPRKKLEKPRKRIGIYLEEELIIRFKHHHKEYGDFTSVINDLLRARLEELDSGEREMEKAKQFTAELKNEHRP